MTSRSRSLLLALYLLLVLPAFLSASDPASSEPHDDGDAAFDEFAEFEDFGSEEAVEVHDPLSGFNRAVFVFNDKVYTWVWDPVARGWRFVVPEPGRVAVERMFTNLLTPPRLVNSLLQLKFDKAGLELGRLLVNSTLGIGGLFDPADAWFDWRAPSPEDFGQTLATWGVGEGVPLVLPLLGQSNLRDGFGLIPDGFLNPIYYFTDAPQAIGIWAFDSVNFTSLHIGEYESLKADALDPYTLLRDSYRQNRLKRIEE